MKRTRLCDRALPSYTQGEEIMNAVTHIAGAVLGVLALCLCVNRSVWNGNVYGVVSSAIYGTSLITLYNHTLYHFQRLPRVKAQHR